LWCGIDPRDAEEEEEDKEESVERAEIDSDLGFIMVWLIVADLIVFDKEGKDGDLGCKC